MRLLLAAFAVTAFVSPAAASVALFCQGPNGVAVDAPLSGGVGLGVLSITVQAEGRTWTSETSLEDPLAIVPAQAFSDHETMRFDFADANFERNVVELRLFIAGEGAVGGTLNIPEVGAWPISCEIG